MAATYNLESANVYRLCRPNSGKPRFRSSPFRLCIAGSDASSGVLVGITRESCCPGCGDVYCLRWPVPDEHRETQRTGTCFMTPEYRRQYEYDFFLSRRGSVGQIAQEVADVLLDKGYRVIVQDY